MGVGILLQFDEETTRLLEIVYQGSDVTRRRQGSFDALRPVAGETIADIGCGNGLLTVELGRAVGSTGNAIGIDPSQAMRAAAIERCADLEWVQIIDGTADELPLKSASVDKAVSVQVFEYLDNIPGAVAEAHRILKPNGRLVVGDIHFDSLVWFSENPGRMQRMIDAWDNHFSERNVPALLPPLMRRAGFEVEDIRPVTICDHALKPDGLARMMMQLMTRFAIKNGHLPEDETEAWFEEQIALAESGSFFFSITHFVIVARKGRN